MMLQEHYHGLLRGMARGVDTLDNTINCIVKSNIVMDIQSRNGMNFGKKTRYSVGGIHFDPEKHTVDIPFEYEPKIIIEKLFQLSSYGEDHDDADITVLQLKPFLDIISKGSLRIRCTNKHFHYGRRIVSREITNYKESQSSEINEEDDVNEEDDDDLHYRYEINQIEKLLNEEEEELNENDN